MLRVVDNAGDHQELVSWNCKTCYVKRLPIRRNSWPRRYLHHMPSGSCVGSVKIRCISSASGRTLTRHVGSILLCVMICKRAELLFDFGCVRPKSRLWSVIHSRSAQFPSETRRTLRCNAPRRHGEWLPDLFDAHAVVGCVSPESARSTILSVRRWRIPTRVPFWIILVFA